MTGTGSTRPRGLTIVVQARPRLFLETLADALTATGLVVLGTTRDAGATPDLVARLSPDLCLLHDVDPASCVDAARAVRDTSPSAKLVVISTGNCPQTGRAYDENVVDAVVVQACAFATLGSVLQRVARGERYLAEGARPPVAVSRSPLTLTRRERQVLEQLVRGATTQGIADELGISTHTVRSHVQGLTRKLGARGRTRAVSTALSRNLLESRAS
jgi:DNA-binding NarL/FixJ family response regulator